MAKTVKRNNTKFPQPVASRSAGCSCIGVLFLQVGEDWTDVIDWVREQLDLGSRAERRWMFDFTTAVPQALIALAALAALAVFFPHHCPPKGQYDKDPEENRRKTPASDLYA